MYRSTTMAPSKILKSGRVVSVIISPEFLFSREEKSKNIRKEVNSPKQVKRTSSRPCLTYLIEQFIWLKMIGLEPIL